MRSLFLWIIGLFDFNVSSDVIGKEIVKCIDLAKDGIHAILLVYSVRTRFSKEEEAALKSLQTFFGPKITDYMIVVFTGGDELEADDETLEEYLGRECPEPLKVIFICIWYYCTYYTTNYTMIIFYSILILLRVMISIIVLPLVANWWKY